MTEGSFTSEGASGTKGIRAWLGAAGISLATALAILAPFFWLGTASGHDIQFHISSWIDVAGQWKEGILLPRWTEWANYGFGEPRFIFYPPLSWMLGAALGSILPWTWIPAIFVLVVQTFAGISAFALVRRFVSNYSAALLGAVAYAANPYALLVIYTRSDYAELLATSFYPLLLLAALRLSGLLQSETPQRRRLAPFALLFAAVWLSNAPAGVLASYSLALLFFYASVAQQTFRPALQGTFGIALGLGLAAFYIVPAAYEQRWVNISGALAEGLTPSDNFLFAVTPDSEHDAFNRVASWIAILMIIATLAAAVALGRRLRAGQAEESLRSTFRALSMLAVAASLMMIRISTVLWNYLPKLRFAQFPWRWLAILAVIFALFAAWTAARRMLVPAWIILVVLSSLTGAYLVRHTWWDAEDMNFVKAGVESGTGFEGTDEYDPLGDDHSDIPQKQPEAKLISEEEIDPAPKSAMHVVRWTAEDRIIVVRSEKPAAVRLRLLHYPAWTITVNGVPAKTRRTVSYNAILAPVEAGESRIEAHFTRTADRTVGGWISIASLLSGILLAWPFKRPQQIA
jgi:hypothetical protein